MKFILKNSQPTSDRSLPMRIQAHCIRRRVHNGFKMPQKETITITNKVGQMKPQEKSIIESLNSKNKNQEFMIQKINSEEHI